MCVGIPGQVIGILDAANAVGLVSVAGVRRPVQLIYIVDAAHPIDSCVGDWVLVHVGFAMARIDADEAAKTLALLNELGEVMREREAMEASERAMEPGGRG